MNVSLFIHINARVRHIVCLTFNLFSTPRSVSKIYLNQMATWLSLAY
jgi:hypothetical protein